MTFTLTLINRHGVWQSCDLRLTDPRTGSIQDDYSRKTVGFQCPDGDALMTYAGIGRVTPAGANGVHVSDWVREFLRGEMRTIGQTVEYIRQRATEDLGKLSLKGNIPHMFVVGAFERGQPWSIEIRNFRVLTADRKFGPVEREFRTVAKPVQAPTTSSFIVPWPLIISAKDLSRLQKAAVAPNGPDDPKHFCNFLAAINLRVSQSATANGRLVSPHCITNYLSPIDLPNGGRVKTYHHNFPDGAPAIPIVSPWVFCGIDVTDVFPALMMAGGKRMDFAEVDRAMREGLEARNRLGKPK
jgi:hypothetical protein